MGYQKEKEKMLRNYLQTIRFLNDSSEETIYLYDIAEQTIYFSANASEKYEVPLQDGICPTDRLRDYVSARDGKDLFLPMEEFSERTDRVLHREYQIRNSKGKTFRVHGKERLQCDENGEPLWIVGRLLENEKNRKTDALTGLGNSDALIKDLQECVNRVQDGFLMVLGIDNFKNINNKYGRGFGNFVLKNIAEIIESVLEEELAIYRLDSDKFAINAVGKTKEEVTDLYLRIQDKITLECTISSGVAQYDGTHKDMAEEIYQHAENALDCAKKNGKNMQEFFSEDSYREQMDNIGFEDELRTGIINDFAGFSICYQPQIDAGTFQICGAEALLRYQSPTRGNVSPVEFIPVLEKTELIAVVGEWVLHKALEQCKEWRKYRKDFSVSVNFSYFQLRNKIIADHIIHLLEKLQLPGNALTIEITESIQLQDYRFFNRIFYKLEKYGVGISIDDFGTGYSSLSYLKSVAINEVKIDRCFVSGIQYSAYNYRLIANVVDLAHSAGIRVCCEGVETEEELKALKELNPDILQGYLFSKPCTVEELETAWFREESREYRGKVQQRQNLLLLENSEFTREERESIELDKIASIIDAMDEIVYVRDMETYELLYLNDAGRVITGAYDYKGRKCYEILQNRKTPCEFCYNECQKKEGYFIWEVDNHYLGRHFMVKDKMITWGGKRARLTICLDLTEKEITSKKVQEKLEFEQNIVAATKMLLNEKDKGKAIDKVLEMIGNFYAADRAYLFELQKNEKFWDNTYEWCADGIEAQIRSLQDVPLKVTERWNENFRKGESIMIDDLEEVKEISSLEYEVLNAQKIRSLIVSPIWRDSDVIGFIGVDNPKKREHDPGQVQTMSYFIADRLVKESNKKRWGVLMDFHNEDVLQTVKMGLWRIGIDRKTNERKMFTDRTMLEIMGITGKLSPEKCYAHWYGRTNDGYFHYVDTSIQKMAESNSIIEMQYTWKHPAKGEITLRFMGKRVKETRDMIWLEGYCRSLNDVESQKVIAESRGLMFEYHEKTHSVYFHTSKELLAKESENIEDFPKGWIENGIVHPHFTKKFTQIFHKTSKQPQYDCEEILLKTKNGSYDWFHLSTKEMEGNALDAGTMIVLLEPATWERSMELELQRMSDFYHATLSEKAAYMEIDLESGQVLNIGGLWDSYQESVAKRQVNYREIMLGKQLELVHPDDKELCAGFWEIALPQDVARDEQHIHQIQYRRLLDGRMQWMEIKAHIFWERYSENKYALIYLRNIDSEKRKQLQNEIAATRDHLTGIYNRAAFQKEIEKHMRSKDSEDSILMILDVDNFKKINDRFGHLEGDRVLKQLSDSLMETFRKKDLLGRLGGDEFMIFLKNLSRKDIVERRIAEFTKSFEEVNEYGATCSIGITVMKKDDFSYETSLRRADEALYRCKMQGKNSFAYYEEL